jgi:hypothetical protein
MILKLVTSFVILMITSNAFASNTSLNTMSGINFEDVKGFENKWHLVTVRYRNDNRELRFVYANKKAWQTMKKGKTNYPDGAMFAKIAYLAHPDPSFESSLGPAESRRYQFMLRDQKKFKEHRGWGYALFNSRGEVHPEPVVDQVNACVSCHDIVPERGYVFSWPMNHSPSKKMYQFELPHEEIESKLLPESITVLIPKNFSKVQTIKSELNKYVFQGTLDELKPALAKLSVKKKTPVIFMSEDQKRFTLIYPENLKLECDIQGVKGLFLVSVNTSPNGKLNKVHFCQSFD